MGMCRKTVTVAEAGRILGVCRNSAYRLAKQGVIPSFRLGRKVVVPKAALLRMLRRAQNSGPETA